jgi:hypothetical protein
MGMDVYGSSPTSTEGEYFRANVWYWRPLWSMVEDLYCDLAEKAPNAHFNDGDGLNAKDSLDLSNRILQDLESGKIQEYVNGFNDSKNNIPDEDCTYCNQTGFRLWNQDDGSVLQKQCNSCSGTLKVKPIETWYHMDMDLIKQFQVFLAHSGGFEIH